VLQILGGSLGNFAAFLVIIALWILQSLFGAAWITINLKVARKESPDWSDFAENSRLWWKVLFGSFLYSILVQIGLLLLVIPGIYFMVKYQYFMYVLIENPDIGIWDSLVESGRITKGARWKLLAYFLVSLGVIIPLFSAL
jgi:uncharacterized membrane protein